MKTIVPDYYAGFACIAGKCRHSCCVGWEIDIDEESLCRFRATQGEIGRRLRRDIAETDEGACFILQQGERCPFLNRDNLCDIILELGEESLCQICADHPRFRNFFSDRVEMGLGLCCEEAARLVLTRQEPTELAVLEDDGGCEELSEDEEFLLALRSECMAIVQRREKDVCARVEEMLSRFGVRMPRRSMAEWARFLQKLERLDEGWSTRLEQLASAGRAPELPVGADTPMEQLMVYLLLRHFSGAAEDGDMQGRLQMCVLLWQLVGAIWAQEGGGLAALCDIARMCSAEMEYSQENMDAILQELAMLADEDE